MIRTKQARNSFAVPGLFPCQDQSDDEGLRATSCAELSPGRRDSALFRDRCWMSGQDPIDDGLDSVNPTDNFAQVDLFVIRFQKSFQADGVVADLMDLKSRELEGRVRLQSLNHGSFDVMRS